MTGLCWRAAAPLPLLKVGAGWVLLTLRTMSRVTAANRQCWFPFHQLSSLVGLQTRRGMAAGSWPQSMVRACSQLANPLHADPCPAASPPGVLGTCFWKAHQG